MRQPKQKSSKQNIIKAKEFLLNPTDIALLKNIQDDLKSDTQLTQNILSLELILSTLLQNKSMNLTGNTSLNLETKENLQKYYEEFFIQIVGFISHEKKDVQLLALSTSMKLLSKEGQNPLQSKDTNECYVPTKKLKLILQALLSSETNNTYQINKFTEYLDYNDILFYTWKSIPSIILHTNTTETYIINFLTLLEKLRINENSENKLLCGNPDSIFNYEENLVKRCLNRFWDPIMRWNHTPNTQKQLLIILLESIMTHLEKPLNLTSFLMDSLDVGGSIGLLALQGVFNLMQMHNLDYPDIYTKIYTMFEPEIFHMKTKARLFFLSDLFLSSTHLPENLVAAFVKRLARLSLIAPSEDIIIICMFIGNLIIRHPGLKYLLHKISDQGINSDPYCMEEQNPYKSNATNSSLWEIQTLQNHVLPAVQLSAAFITSEMPKTEWDFSQNLSENGSDMFNKEVKKFSKLIALNYEKPNGMRLSKNEKIFKYWS